MSSTPLLTRCLRTHPDGSLRQELHDLSHAAWHRLVDDAMRHGVAPLLHHRLQAREDLRVPVPAAERLRDLYLHNHLVNITIFEQLADVLGQFHYRGLPVIPLKGAHLASRIYEEPALRPMADLDLLVLPSDLSRVHAALKDTGYADVAKFDQLDYTDFHHLQPVSKPGAFSIEVHHELARGANPFDVDLAGVWARAEEVEVAGVGSRVCVLEDLILHLCTHASYNHRFRIPLLLLCDVDVVVRHGGEQINWDLLVGIANADGRARFVYSTLKLVQRALGTPLPDTVARLHHRTPDDDVVTDVLACIVDAPVDVPVTLSALEGTRSFAGTVRRVWRGVFPNPDRMRKIYGLETGSAAVYWYYLVRPVDLVVRRGVQLAGLLFRTRDGRVLAERLRRQRLIERWVEGDDSTHDGHAA